MFENGEMRKCFSLILIAIMVALLSSASLTTATMDHRPYGRDNLRELFKKKMKVDGSLLSYPSEKLIRVGMLVDASIDFEKLLEHVEWMRIAPSIGGLYFVRAMIRAGEVNAIASIPEVLRIAEDRRIPYPIEETEEGAGPMKHKLIGITFLSEFQSRVKPKFRLRLPGINVKENIPQTTLRNITEVIGAKQAWSTYGVTGDGVSIAIVDTGVDYGAFSLAYWNSWTTTTAGAPSAFDPDELCVVLMDTGGYVVVKDARGYLNTTGLIINSYSPFYGIVQWLVDVDWYAGKIESKSGVYRIGVMYQWLWGDDWIPVLLVDANTPGVYDTVYVDMTFFWAVYYSYGEMYFDEDASGSYSPGESIYRDIDGSGDVSEGDFRLTDVNGYPAGSIVQFGDTDIGRPLTFFSYAYEMHTENVDENGIYDPSEWIYVDVDGNGYVSAGDIRLTDVNGYPAGSIVQPEDTDEGLPLICFTYTYFDHSFADEPAVTLSSPICARDITGDGINDVSMGILGYALDINGLGIYLGNPPETYGIFEPIDPEGMYVCFVNDWHGHGTACASCAAGRDIGHPFTGAGVAPGAKIMGIPALWIGDIIEGWLWAAGFELMPGTEGWYYVPTYGWVWGYWEYTGDHRVDIISNSWGWSNWIEYTASTGEFWYTVLSMFEDALTVPGYLHPEFPGVIMVHAAGNGGPGFGTVTEPGISTLATTCGASTCYYYTEMFGYHGRADEVIFWSARGPTHMGVVKPDIVDVGAYGITPYPVWYGGYSGFDAIGFFGGTSMATPLTAGAYALIIEAFTDTHGRKPTPQEAKIIMKSSAKDIGYSAFYQGSGRVDCLSAVKLAMGSEGFLVYTDATWSNVREIIREPWLSYYAFLGYGDWSPPKGPIYDVNWFAGRIKPGKFSSANILVENPTSSPMTVSVSAYHYKLIDEVTVTINIPLAPGYLWYTFSDLGVTIPKRADLMIVQMFFDYDYFDPDRDYSWNARVFFNLFDWIDNGDGVLSLDELYRINDAYTGGNSYETTVGYPSSTFVGEPVLRISAWPLTTSVIPCKFVFKFYKQEPWNWIRVPSRIKVRAGGISRFRARLMVPRNTIPGVYEGFIMLKSNSWKVLMPVSVVVPQVITPMRLVYDISSGINIGEPYEPYIVKGGFDWSWRYEAGDWKLYSFEVKDPYDQIAAVFFHINWKGTMTDIDIFTVNPPTIMGDYSSSPYLGSGRFMWHTRTGTTSEYVVVDTQAFAWGPWLMVSKGVYTMLLHNVLYNGSHPYPEYWSGNVSIIKSRFIYIRARPRPNVRIFGSRYARIAARPGQKIIVIFNIATGHSLTNVNFVKTGDFSITFTPSSISYLPANSYVRVYAMIHVPSTTSPGLYSGDFEIFADELPFSIKYWLDIYVYGR